MVFVYGLCRYGVEHSGLLGSQPLIDRLVKYVDHSVVTHTRITHLRRSPCGLPMQTRKCFYLFSHNVEIGHITVQKPQWVDVDNYMYITIHEAIIT